MSSDYVSLHRQPFLTPLWLSGVAVVLLAAFVAWLGFATWLWTTAHSTTVVVIRHAEKQWDAGDDPPLTPQGQARAQLLARMFGTTADAASAGPPRPGKLDAIYVTPALRNRETAAPLARRLGLEPIVDGDDRPAELVYRVLHEHPGGRVLIVGHADSVPAIVGQLCAAAKIPPLGVDEYGTMYIVTVPRIGTANYLKITY